MAPLQLHAKDDNQNSNNNNKSNVKTQDVVRVNLNLPDQKAKEDLKITRLLQKVSITNLLPQGL